MVINASHVTKNDILGPPFETPQIGTYRINPVCELFRSFIFKPDTTAAKPTSNNMD
jgi:hypothetical protein